MPKPRSGTGRLRSTMARVGFELAQRVAEIVASPSHADLREQLRKIARTLAGFHTNAGVMVVALDAEEFPLTSGSESLSLRWVGSELERLFELHQILRLELGRVGWIDLDATILTDSEQDHCLALALPVHSTPNANACGLVLVRVPLDKASDIFLQTLEASSAILAAAIQSAVRSEAWNRIEALQQLAQETFNTKEQGDWDLKALVGRLGDDFEAGAVTLLLKDQEELRLAVSTDQHLGEDPQRPVVYLRDEGLTGYVFATGRALRLINTDDAEEIRDAIGRIRKGPIHPERDKDGSFTGQFMGVPLRFGGKVVGVLRMSRREGVARFTHEDQKALQFFADLLGAALAPSWDLLLERSVVASVTESIMVTRREKASLHRLVMANPGAQRLLDRSEEQIRGLETSEIYAPDEYTKLRTPLQEALKARKKSCGPFQTRLRRPDGSLVPVTVSYQFLANNLVQPPTFYTIGLARDISESERQAAQHQRLLNFFETLGIAYFQADQDGMTLVSTELDSVITGYPPEELKKLPRQRLYDEPKNREHLLDKARRNQDQVVGEVVQMRRKNGTLFWAEGDLRIRKDTGGSEIGYEGFYRDVTDRIRLQRFLNEDKERVLTEEELFTRLKQEAEFHLDYLSSLGHQLQTPLNSLSQTLQNLEKGIASQRTITDRLPYVIGQARVCTRLVRNLSYMDKVLRGEPFQREKVSLAKLAIETKLDFSHLLKEKRLELVVDSESLDRTLIIQGHQEMLRQVMVNLVDNAIKYSLQGTSIHINARHWPDGPSLEMSNVGLPIPEEEREKIFQRGYRTQKAQAFIPHGTGLGLWLVRKIVEAHGAMIQLHDLSEGGPQRNLFRVCFPQSTSSRRTS